MTRISAEPGARRRAALGEFLRARRAGVVPADVSLPTGGARKTAGLRREEVAVLAGVSVTWYTWLEQGRSVNPSDEVLRAIARALLLDDDATAHLLMLAHPGSVGPGPAEVPAVLQDLVDGQYPAPAILIDLRWDLITWNRSSEAVFGWSRLPLQELNVACLMFHPYLRARLVDWESHARRVVGEVRAGSVGLDGDPRFEQVLGQLQAADPRVPAWWSAHEVRARTGVRKDFDHSDAGMLRMQEVILRPAGAPDLQMVVLQPVPGTDTAARLADLVLALDG